MKIPFGDLKAQHRLIQSEIEQTIRAVIDQSAFIRGPYVEKFEKEFAAKLKVKHCISCANGTDALYIALRAFNLNPEDEVITTAHSWISTSEAITQAGGRVVFCDIDSDTFNINPKLIKKKITSRTKGIVAVHLYGQPAEMKSILSIAKRYGLWVIEDTSQAHLAKLEGRFTGTLGDIGTFSFYPGKNLGAMGDSGCIVTNNDGLAHWMTMFARHGGLKKGEHEIEGINSRLDGLQAAILSIKLRHLSSWTKRRKEIARTYDTLLSGIGDLLLPKAAEGCEHVYHLYVIRTEAREALKRHLSQKDISTTIHYPLALPFLKAYAYLKYKPEDFPIAHWNQSRILSLPMYPELTEDQIRYVAEQIRKFFV